MSYRDDETVAIGTMDESAFGGRLDGNGKIETLRPTDVRRPRHLKDSAEAVRWL